MFSNFELNFFWILASLFQQGCHNDLLCFHWIMSMKTIFLWKRLLFSWHFPILNVFFPDFLLNVFGKFVETSFYVSRRAVQGLQIFFLASTDIGNSLKAIGKNGLKNAAFVWVIDCLSILWISVENNEMNNIRRSLRTNEVWTTN